MSHLRILWLFLVCYPMSVSTQGIYDPLHLVKIELTFQEEDWQYPLHYYHSLSKGDRHTGRAVVDGTVFDGVGVRFKGFSSYNRNNAKNPLNIKLDHTQKEAEYQGHDKLKLSNGNLDPSWLREVLAYQIARKYMPAPQSNFAEVYVNGKYHGLFGNTESVDAGFAKRHFNGDKISIIFKGNSPLGPFLGKRSSLQYLGPDTTAYYDAYELESSHGWSELARLIETLNRRPGEVESVLDMDGAIWMLAFNNVLVNLDSYSDFQQNFYLVQDNNGRFRFVPWDLNLAFDGLGKPHGVAMQHDYDPLAHEHDERFPLINLVLRTPRYRKAYFAHCHTILQENFANGWYKEEAEKYRALIADAVRRDSNWVFRLADFEKNFTATIIKETPSPFPYPGLVELMDARTTFLQNHPEYRKKPPVIDSVEATLPPTGLPVVSVKARIENATRASVFYREKSSHAFQEIPLHDNGQGGDNAPGDGIFTAMIPAGGKKLEYYIYAENGEAAMFSPERAAHEFHVFRRGGSQLPF